MLECRLDNIVYRLGFASTLRQARQMVVHGHIPLNGHKADKPSIQIKPGDVVTLKEKSRSVDYSGTLCKSYINPSYLEKDIDSFSETYQDAAQGGNTHSGERFPVTEFYSRR